MTKIEIQGSGKFKVCITYADDECEEYEIDTSAIGFEVDESGDIELDFDGEEVEDRVIRRRVHKQKSQRPKA